MATSLNDPSLNGQPFFTDKNLSMSIRNCAMQALEKVPGIHLVNAIIKRKARKTRGRSAPKGLSGWAKAQMMMLYAVEHDEMWCHKGFLQACFTHFRLINFQCGIGTAPERAVVQERGIKRTLLWGYTIVGHRR